MRLMTRVESLGGHDHVTVWADANDTGQPQNIGRLTVAVGEGSALAAILELGAASMPPSPRRGTPYLDIASEVGRLRAALRGIADDYDHEHHSLRSVTAETCDGPGHCRVCTAEVALAGGRPRESATARRLQVDDGSVVSVDVPEPDVDSLEWRCRYSVPTRSELLSIASVLGSWRYIVAGAPTVAIALDKVRQVRRALAAQGVHGGRRLSMTSRLRPS